MFKNWLTNLEKASVWLHYWCDPRSPYSVAERFFEKIKERSAVDPLLSTTCTISPSDNHLDIRSFSANSVKHNKFLRENVGDHEYDRGDYKGDVIFKVTLVGGGKTDLRLKMKRGKFGYYQIEHIQLYC